MRKLAAALLVAAALAAPAAAQNIIGMSLVEALVAIEHPELAGVFAYVPESQSAVALADLLLRDRSAFKRFVKKGEKDLAQAGAVNQWDKEVYLHLVTAASGAVPGVKPVPKSLSDRVSKLALAPGVPLQVLVQQRGVKR